MKNPLDKLSKEELGNLFPIILSDPNPDWPEIYKKEKETIIKILGEKFIERIEHIGSTSIPGLTAKPTIDILLEIPEYPGIKDLIIKTFLSIGYNYIPKPENPPPHLMMVKGYTTEGFKGQAFHIHVRYKGDWDEIHFRDYLRLNPKAAEKYVKLKQKLAIRYKNDREAYTEGKTDFIEKIMRKITR